MSHWPILSRAVYHGKDPPRFGIAVGQDEVRFHLF